MDASTFRGVLGQWPTGVAIVTTSLAGEWHGLTASSFSSVSLEPPLVSVCIATSARAHDQILAAGQFAVTILGKDQVDLGKQFAGGRPAVERFDGLRCATAVTGSPVLPDGVGWVDCTVHAAHPAGDHTLFIGAVVAAEIPRRSAPLLYHSRAWGQFADVLPERVDVVDTGTCAGLADGVSAVLDRAIAALLAAGVERVRVPSGRPAPQGLAGSWLVVSADEVQKAAELGISVVETADVTLAPVAHAHGLTCRVLVLNAFESGDSTARVAAAIEAGADEVCLQGSGDPLQVRSTLQDVVGCTGRTTLSVALDDTNGFGLANALTALKSGVSRFDVSIGGIGNRLAAEDLLLLAERLGIASALNRDLLAHAACELDSTLGGLPSRTRNLMTQGDTR